MTVASVKTTIAMKSTQVNAEKAHRHSSKLLVHGEQGLVCYRAALTCFCSDRVVFLRLYGLHSCVAKSAAAEGGFWPRRDQVHVKPKIESSGACFTRQGSEMMACRCIIHSRSDAVSCLQPSTQRTTLAGGHSRSKVSYTAVKLDSRLGLSLKARDS